MATTTTTKKETTEEVVKETKPVETKAAKSDSLDAKMANLTDLMSQFVQAMMANQAARTEVRAPEDKIVIVHLAQTDPQLGTTIHLSNTEIGMTEFGEERQLTIQQFEELLSKYRSWFAKGLLCVADGYEEAAKKYGVTTAGSCPIDKTFIKGLGDIPMSKIEEVYAKLPEYGKENLVSYWIRCAYDGNPKFTDMRKLRQLNDITGGKFDNVIIEFDGRKDTTEINRPNIVRY